MNEEDQVRVTPDGDMSGSDADKFSDLRSAKPWQDMLDDAQSTFDPWYKACKNVNKQYADLTRLRSGTDDREYNIFWANLETLLPAIYARPPKPVVVPRFKDRRPLYRETSEILERALIANADVQSDHEEYTLARNSLARTSRGVLWTRYDIRDGKYEAAPAEHVHGEDFLHEPARTWREVGWVARRSWLTKDEGVKRFGQKFLAATFTTKENDTPDEYKFDKKAEVWEVWSRTHGAVVWISPDLEEVLDISEPHISFEGFFPCPRPAYATLQPDSLIPVPDYLFYKDQVEEINILTNRIHALAEKLKAKGFYPSGGEDIASAIEKAWDDLDEGATLVGVANLNGMTQGMDRMIAWLPIRDISETLKACLELRRQLIEDIYQITGISDIMRGATQASETATAQTLKSQYGSVRIRERQEEMKRLCRDATALQGEIIAEHFQPQTIMQMTQSELPQEAQKQQQAAQIQQQMQQAQQGGQQVPPEQQQQMAGQMEAMTKKLEEIGQQVTVEQVMELLRNERLRPFVLDIETDSTIQPDEDADKQRRGEFINYLSSLLAQALPLLQAAPEAAPFVGEVLRFSTAPYRAGRGLEGAIDDLVDGITQKASQPQPDPAAEAEKTKMAMEQQKMQADQAMKQQDAQARQQEAQVKAQADQAKHGMEMQALQAKMQAEAQQAELQMQQMEAKHAAEMEKIGADIAKIEASSLAQQQAAQQRAQASNGATQ